MSLGQTGRMDLDDLSSRPNKFGNPYGHRNLRCHSLKENGSSLCMASVGFCVSLGLLS